MITAFERQQSVVSDPFPDVSSSAVVVAVVRCGSESFLKPCRIPASVHAATASNVADERLVKPDVPTVPVTERCRAPADRLGSSVEFSRRLSAAVGRSTQLN